MGERVNDMNGQPPNALCKSAQTAHGGERADPSTGGEQEWIEPRPGPLKPGSKPHCDPQPAGTELHEAFRNKDAEYVVSILWQHWRGPLIGRILTWSIPEAEADDVLQEVLALVASKCANPRSRGFDSEDGLLGWVWTLTDYECRSHHNRALRFRRKHRALALGTQPPDRHPSGLRNVEREIAERQALALVREFYDGLGPNDRTLFDLVFHDRCTSREVAQHLEEHSDTHRTPGAVRARTRRLRSQLVRLFMRRQPEEGGRR